MNKRPKSVTVISWILIVLGGISLISTTAMFNNPTALDLLSKSPLPISVQYVISYLSVLIIIVAGIVMLKGQNWGRLLYVVGNIIGFVIGVTTSPMKAAMIPGFIIFLIVAFFLFRPKANEYFSKQKAPVNA
jgi:hypothetical protein